MGDAEFQPVSDAVQQSLPAVWMRGGTSKALFFHRQHLPPTRNPHDCASWNAIFRAAMGSPDPYGRQLDGMGGGQSSLSKIAVIAPSERPDADVEFTFAQVGITDDTVGYKGNCGNISSAVGPFALDEGLVQADGDKVTVRIFNTNTQQIIVADFPVVNGRAAVAGGYAMQGVAGSGAPIRLAFIEPGGAATGRLLPTGSPANRLEIESGKAFDTSLVDAANPVVFLRASALGLSGTEAPAVLRKNARAMTTIEAIRIAAALKMGLATTREEAATRLKNLPLVALVAETPSAASNDPDAPDILVRMVSAGLPHGAVPLTGALCMAVAARIPGTLVNAVLPESANNDRLRIGHASGDIHVTACVDELDGELQVREAVVFRTARRLMDGRVFIPSSGTERVRIPGA